MACKLAGYSGTPQTLATQGHRNLAHAGIREYMAGRWESETMQPDEVVARLSRQGRASAQLYLDGDKIDLRRLELFEALDLVKKVKIKRTTTTDKQGNTVEREEIEVELYDAQGALDKLARIHALYKLPDDDAQTQQITAEELAEAQDKLAKGVQP